MGVYEDEEVGKEGGEGEGWGEEGPGGGVRVEDYGEEGYWGFCIDVCVSCCGLGREKEGKLTFGGLAVVVGAVEVVHFDSGLLEWSRMTSEPEQEHGFIAQRPASPLK